jgi:hypothetical protein
LIQEVGGLGLGPLERRVDVDDRCGVVAAGFRELEAGG